VISGPGEHEGHRLRGCTVKEPHPIRMIYRSMVKVPASGLMRDCLVAKVSLGGCRCRKRVGRSVRSVGAWRQPRSLGYPDPPAGPNGPERAEHGRRFKARSVHQNRSLPAGNRPLQTSNYRTRRAAGATRLAG
jgi:hypothetical protein